MERDYGIDWLKAFAIVLMVIGHAIQYSLVTDYDSNLIFRFIYSFHMPLFIFISGYLAHTGHKKGFLWKRVRLLLVPFLIWMVLYAFYYRRLDLQQGNWAILPSYFWQVIQFPGKGGLWFLWTLFQIDVVYSLLKKTTHFYLFSGLFLVALYVAAPFWEVLNCYGFGLLRFYYPFFLLGCFFRQRNLIEKVNLPLTLFLVGLWVVLELAWSRSGDVNAFGLPVASDTNSVYAQIVRWLTPVPAIVLFFKLSRLFQRGNAVVQWLSVNTLAIYASHFIWIYLFTDLLGETVLKKSATEITLVFAITGFFTWLTILLVRKSSVLRQLLFGR
jgi:fucose 4-O-acetylase-like acetyltransferase